MCMERPNNDFHAQNQWDERNVPLAYGPPGLTAAPYGPPALIGWKWMDKRRHYAL